MRFLKNRFWCLNQSDCFVQKLVVDHFIVISCLRLGRLRLGIYSRNQAWIVWHPQLIWHRWRVLQLKRKLHLGELISDGLLLTALNCISGPDALQNKFLLVLVLIIRNLRFKALNLLYKMHAIIQLFAEFFFRLWALLLCKILLNFVNCVILTCSDWSAFLFLLYFELLVFCLVLL